MKMRVLSIPRRTHENRYFSLLLDSLERNGMEVVEPSPGRAARFAFDVLHLNFPTHYITQSRLPRAIGFSIGFTAFMLLTRLLGRKIVYTVHDVVPFTRRHGVLLTGFLWLTHALTNGFIFLSQSSRDHFIRCYGRDAGKPWLLVQLGRYPSEPVAAETRRALRRQLTGRDDAYIVGFLGRIRPYKNIDALRAVPRRLPDGRPVFVVVAGESLAQEAAATEAALDAIGRDRTIRQDWPLSDVELDRLMQCVDVVALPYSKGSNSSAAMLALGNEACVIGSGLPIFQELERSVGAPWLRTARPGPAPQIDALVVQAAANPPTVADRDRLRTFLDAAGFDRIAESIGGFYRQLRAE